MLAAVCFLWAGMVLGVSFLATPVKFTAPSVTLPIGLDIGRHVFGMFNEVEIGWAVLACGLIVWSRPRRAVWLPLAAAVGVVLLQSAWLLPLLDARVELILRDRPAPPAPHHLVYIALELLKLLGLLAAGTAALRGLHGSPESFQNPRSTGWPIRES
jgi:hypothetical protein